MVAAAVAKAPPLALAGLLPLVQQPTLSGLGCPAPTIRMSCCGRRTMTWSPSRCNTTSTSTPVRMGNTSMKTRLRSMYSWSEKELRSVGRGEFVDFTQVYLRTSSSISVREASNSITSDRLSTLPLVACAVGPSKRADPSAVWSSAL